MKKAQQRELIMLWHCARIAGAFTRWERLQWAAKEFAKAHGGKPKRPYNWLAEATRGYGA